jgi:protoheme IX farnesyltransferase
VNRFQKLTAATIGMTFLLVTIGVFVRATDAGLGCPDWPFCYGQVIPPLDDPKAWYEWIHRFVAAALGVMVLGIVVLAVVDYRRQLSVMLPSFIALGLVTFQAWLGRETVRLGNSGESVTAHLAAAMALFGLLIFILVRTMFPARIAGHGGSQRFTLLAAFGAASVFALLLFGSQVTATDSALIYPDWPLMGGSLFPPLTDVSSPHVLHRWIAVVVGVIVAIVALAAWRTQRGHPTLVRLALLAAVLYLVQAVVGGLQVLTQLTAWTQVAHVALGAIVWGLMAGLTFESYYVARIQGQTDAGADPGSHSIGEEPGQAPPGTLKDTIRAYIALTKPRIIELLLITTVPAMFLAARGVPPLDLIFWTLVGGSLAAGSANAINCYVDRDIDILMVRTRRRPLPAHQVSPENAVLFGIVLGVISLLVMAWFVNLLAAFLTLLAIGFYVVVYTLLLKRTTPQNIVIGGAAGALPPVIGWAAVTGNVEVPALLLFALIFYWTPPHFWALAVRIRKDYAAAGVPMLPVVRGIAETTRQIGLYTVLLVAISLVLFAVARMGLIYLVAAVGLGAIFLWQAYRLWRVGSSEEESTAGAIRLYRYSISYLTLLMLAVAIDAVVTVPVA